MTTTKEKIRTGIRVGKAAMLKLTIMNDWYTGLLSCSREVKDTIGKGKYFYFFNQTGFFTGINTTWQADCKTNFHCQ
jgi:hypothetical protein